ncbi:autotransporter strand-loop-strand O-heptosyltransferase [Salmonella enterica]|uniref:autotransporter strand-loop-strand O-heptosyltransferase n=1 Tax=Escherichia coli TaxID=562 RepID=UPI0005A817FC|nr:autotransporter strand-loop-strand O-heptosyltransferase [Escherichia coli]EFC1147591.1 autotransporter strand-loop-strand O-heptosyltransferase [Escherichia coli]MGW04228.1 autotransporter strand-loop-strand O-heptosyltransferase [Salmonella enterica]HCJ7760363.1 autotransporter strand-loop-strand O-heptosyltransferase [Citrobacter freundii]
MSFASPPEEPVIKGCHGIKYDFNDGLRILLPEGLWYVIITDDDSGNIIYRCNMGAGWITSTKKYYVKFHLQIYKEGERIPVINEVMDLKNKSVIINFPVGTLGDLIAWFPYAEKFQHKHQCRVECIMGQDMIELFSAQYPDMIFSTPDAIKTELPYATYRIGIFFGGDTDHQPIDFRKVGFHRNAGYILGVDTREIPPRLDLTAAPLIDKPYVCIAVQSTCQAKYWNNGTGWSEVIHYLKSLNYRVICIDKNAHHGDGFVWNHIPHGAEDFTGDIPLQERINLLVHARFFIGLGSGLSWLAWACGIPVILISGFSLPSSEFFTPWRVFNSHGCNGCWDDQSVIFEHDDFLWCPHHKGTERQFECTRLITGKQVCRMIDELIFSQREKYNEGIKR